MKKSGVANTHAKIQNQLDIHFPPNFNINTREAEEPQVKTNLFEKKPRLG